MRQKKFDKPQAPNAAFTVPEAVMAMLIMALICTGVYGGISLAFQNVQLTRQDVRASQILVQTMEVLRLFTWSQSDPSTNFLPTSFTAAYETSGSTGLVYQVTVSVTNAPSITEAYSNDLRLVTVQAAWTNSGVPRTRAMSTYVSKAGLLWYVPY